MTSVASKIPVENYATFPVDFQSIDYQLEKYINIFFPQQWAASWAIIHFHTYTGQFMTSHISVPGTVSMLRPLLLLYFIIIYVDAPCLWNIKMTMTGTIL